MNSETFISDDDLSLGSSIVRIDYAKKESIVLPKENEPNVDVNSSIRFYYKPRKNSTKIPVIKEVDKTNYNSLDYESWYGRIDSIDKESVVARLSSRLPEMCSRIVVIEKEFFVSKGISSKLSTGDEFELTLKRVQWPKGQIEEKTTVRMIERVVLSEQDVDMAYEEDLKELSFLFNSHE